MNQTTLLGGRVYRVVRRLFLSALLLLAFSAMAVFGLLYWQGSRAPDTSGNYVALGSSFAAGIGLGPTAAGSPVQCMRTNGGYPSRVAERTGLHLVDMTCSGSTTTHIIDGGQLLLGPQLAAVGPATKVVTITSGGNDVGYIGDLMAASGGMGRLGAYLHGPAQPAHARSYGLVADRFEAMILAIRRISPGTRIILVSYPAILPPVGSCAALGISERQADVSRAVAQQLTLATQRAAVRTGADFVDMGKASVGHDACSNSPWTNGAKNASGTAFHPNIAGASATADAIIAILRSPTGTGKRGLSGPA